MNFKEWRVRMNEVRVREAIKRILRDPQEPTREPIKRPAKFCLIHSYGPELMNFDLQGRRKLEIGERIEQARMREDLEQYQPMQLDPLEKSEYEKALERFNKRYEEIWKDRRG